MVASAGFFESEAQLDALLDWAGGEPLQLVALSAAADEAAERRGIEYVTIEDLYSEEELLARGAENFAALETLIEHVGVDARLYAFQLKGLLDVVLHRGLTCLRALEHLAPSRVVLFPPGRADVDDLLRCGGESLAMRAIKLLARARGIETIELPFRDAQAERRSSHRPALRAAAGRLVRRLRRARTRKGLASGLTLVLTGFGPDREVIDAWVEAGGRVVDAAVLSPDTPNGLAPQHLDVDETTRRMFELAGIDLFPLAEARLRHFAGEILHAHAAYASAAERLLRGIERPIVLGAVPVFPRDVAVFAAARLLDVPSAVHQHGGFLGYAEYPMARNHEFVHSDEYICYGEGVARVVEGATPIVVGSAALDRLRRIGKPSRRVVYVPTLLMGDARYFSHHIYPDIWYARLQRSVVDRCAHFADAEIIVKPPLRDEAENPLVAWIERQRYSNVTVVRDAPFAELLGDAGLVVIDSPATTLLEALAADVPVVAYADERWMTFHDDAVARLREVALFSTTREEFLTDIERALTTGSARSEGNAFLAAFGTHLDDGRSAQRAVDALVGLAARVGAPA